MSTRATCLTIKLALLLCAGVCATAAHVLSSVSATVSDWVTPDKVTFTVP